VEIQRGTMPQRGNMVRNNHLDLLICKKKKEEQVHSMLHLRIMKA
jgi:hypothetical protein